MSQKTLFLVFSFVILACSIVNAEQDFTFSVPQNIELCPCSNQAYPVLVQNTGDEDITLSMSVTGQASSWITFDPQAFTLQPGQASNILAYVNSACNIEGSAIANIIVSSQAGLAKQITQSLVFNKCYDYSVTFGRESPQRNDAMTFGPKEGSYLVCKGDSAIIPILLENKEEFANKYSIFLDAPEFASLEANAVDLASNSKGIVLINVENADILGKQDLKISVLSELGHVQQKAQASIVVDDCQGVAVDITSDSVLICAGTTEVVDVTLTNNGIGMQNVLLKIDGAEFGRLQNATFSLDANEAAATKLFIFSQDEEDFDLTITANVNGNEISSDSLHVEVADSTACYEPQITIPDAIRNYYEHDIYTGTIKNKGSAKNTYQATLEGAVWASVVPRMFDLNKGAEGKLTFAVNPPDSVEPGEYPLELTIETNGQEYKKSIVVKVSKPSYFSNLFATLAFYQYYIYAALIIIILLVVVVYFFLRIRRKDESYDYDDNKPIVIEPVKETKKESKKQASKIVKKKKSASKKSKEPSIWSSIPASIFAYIFLGILLLAAILAVVFIGALQPLRDFFSLYSLYLMIGIGILIIVILLVRFIKPLRIIFKDE